MDNRGRTKMGGPQRTAILLYNLITSKLRLAIEFAARASIYNPESTALELTTAQCLLLTLVNGLLKNDISLCITVLEVAPSVEHLHSTSLPIWLRDDFLFTDDQVGCMLSNLAGFIYTQSLVVPNHILQVFLSLCSKYQVQHWALANTDIYLLRMLAENSISSKEKSVTSDRQSISSVQNSRADIGGNPSSEDSEESADDFIIVPSASSSDQFTSNSSNASNSPANNATENNAATPVSPWHEDSCEDSHFINIVSTFLGQQHTKEAEEIMELINRANSEGCTPLHRAAREGCSDVVEAMLELGAVAEVADSWGYTPAHCAASAGALNVLIVLAQHCVDLSRPRGDGCTPLHDSIVCGHTECARWLLDHGSDMNAADTEGWTPLHYAAHFDQLEVCKNLINYGAVVCATTKDGKTPIDLAIAEGNLLIVQALSAG